MLTVLPLLVCSSFGKVLKSARLTYRNTIIAFFYKCCQLLVEKFLWDTWKKYCAKVCDSLFCQSLVSCRYKIFYAQKSERTELLVTGLDKRISRGFWIQLCSKAFLTYHLSMRSGPQRGVPALAWEGTMWTKAGSTREGTVARQQLRRGGWAFRMLWSRTWENIGARLSMLSSEYCHQLKQP